MQVGIKSYEKTRLTEPNHWRRVQQEIKLMERMNHPHIIRLLETFDSPKRIHIVMEYAGGYVTSYVRHSCISEGVLGLAPSSTLAVHSHGIHGVAVLYALKTAYT